MTCDSPLIEAKGLTRRHPDGQRWLLDDASLRIACGDRVTVAGPSGSGKSLLLRALALLDPLDSGEVLWHGWPVRRERVPGFRCQAIYVHQRPALSGESVEAAIRLPLALGAHRGRQFDRERILGWLDELGRDASFLAKTPGDLSGGELQIVALVRALQLDPAVLMLDEPTAALDRGTTGAAEGLLDRWVAESPDARALVWVTHDVAQAQRTTRRVVRMEEGRLTEEEPHAG